MRADQQSAGLCLRVEGTLLMKTAVELLLRAVPLLFLCGAIAVVGGCSRLAGDPLAKTRELDEKNQYRDSPEMLRALQVTFPTAEPDGNTPMFTLPKYGSLHAGCEHAGRFRRR